MKKALIGLVALVLIGALATPFFLPRQYKLKTQHELTAAPAELYEALSNTKNFSEWYFLKNKDSLSFEYFSPYTGTGAIFEPADSTIEDFGGGEVIFAQQDSAVNIVLWDAEKAPTDTLRFTLSDLSAGKLRLNVEHKGAKVSYFQRYFLSTKKTEEQEIWKKRFLKLEKHILEKEQTAHEQEVKVEMNKVVFDKFAGLKLLAISNKTTRDSVEVQTAIAESAGMVKSFLVDTKKVNEEDIIGPVVFWPYWDDGMGEFEFFCGYGIRESVEYPEEFVLKAIPAEPTAKIVFEGNYGEHTPKVLQIIDELEKAKLTPGEQLWMIYDQTSNGAKKVEAFVPVIP